MKAFKQFLLDCVKNKTFAESYNLTGMTGNDVFQQIKLILDEKVNYIDVSASSIRNILNSQGKTTIQDNSEEAVDFSILENIPTVLRKPSLISDASYSTHTGLGVMLSYVVKDTSGYILILAIDGNKASVVNFYSTSDIYRESEPSFSDNDSIEGLGAIDSDYIKRAYNDGFRDLYNRAVYLASMDERCKIALDWSSEVDESNIYAKVECFIAACLVQEAGFHHFDTLPKPQSSVKDPLSNGDSNNGYIRYFDREHGIYKPWTYPIFYTSHLSPLVKNRGIWKRFYSAPNTFLHELCHAIHFSCLNFNPRVCQAENKAKGRSVTFEVSEYANANGIEFHSEILSGIIQGRRFAKNILAKISSPDKNIDAVDMQAYQALKFNGLSKPADFYWPKLLQGNTDKLVTRDNIATYQYSNEQKSKLIFAHYEYIRDVAVKNYYNGWSHRILVDTFLRVMNDSYMYITSSAMQPVSKSDLGAMPYPIDFNIPAGPGAGYYTVEKAEKLVDMWAYTFSGTRRVCSPTEVAKVILSYHNKALLQANICLRKKRPFSDWLKWLDLSNGLMEQLKRK